MDPDKNKMQKAKVPKKPPRKLPVKQTDHVEVFCRIRPLDISTELSCVRRINDTTLALVPPESSRNFRVGSGFKETQHTFQFVFDEQTCQKSLFDQVGLSLVDFLLRGKNSLLLTYGVTSSGKTYTMSGTPHKPGILSRSIECIFASIGEQRAKKYMLKPDKMNGFDVQSEAEAMLERQNRDITPRLTGLRTVQLPQSASSGTVGFPCIPAAELLTVEDIDVDCLYAVFISYVEIYNNYVYDLLDEEQISANRQPTSKNIREDADHNMYVSGVAEVEISSPQDAYDVLLKGQKRRKVANTALNSESSRSHSTLNIRLVRLPLDVNGEPILDKRRLHVSQLSLVDLAGSERSQRTGAVGDRMKEAGNINNSLMALRVCIEALRENQKSGANKLVPYRDSKLTHLFKNYFDGEGKVKMIVCINSKPSDFDETLQVMKFAELTQEVQIARPQAPRIDLIQPSTDRRLQSKELSVLNMGDYDEDSAESSVIYSLGPSFPSLELHIADDEVTLKVLATFLQDREARRSYLSSDLSRKDESFRQRLIVMEKEQADSRLANSQLRSNLSDKENELSELKRRVSYLERNSETYLQKIALYEYERHELEIEVGEKSWKLIQEKLDKDRLRQDFHAKLAIKDLQYKQEVEQVRRRACEEADVRLRSKQQKLDLMRRVLDSDSGGSASSADGASLSRGSQASAPVVSLKAHLFTTKSDPDLVNNSVASNVGAVSRNPALTSRAPVIVPRLYQQRQVPVRTRSPMKCAVPKKFHRRSRSSDALLLNSRPQLDVTVSGKPQRLQGNFAAATGATDFDTTQRSTAGRKRRSSVSDSTLDHSEVEQQHCWAGSEGYGISKKSKYTVI